MLAGLQEQLEDARTKPLTATHQRILANNYVAMAKAERDRTQALSVQQDRVKRDLRQQLAQTQNVVVDL